MSLLTAQVYLPSRHKDDMLYVAAIPKRWLPLKRVTPLPNNVRPNSLRKLCDDGAMSPLRLAKTET